MIKVILDTNILVSALGWEGKPQEILNYVLDKRFKLVISLEILEEIKNVLFREKFNFINNEKKNEFILLLSELSEIITPFHKVEICRDKEDNKFIELALSAEVNIIVSGDEDLLILKKFKKIKILTADEFLEFLKK